MWDTRALVAYSVNGTPAGGVLRVGRGKALTARIRLSAQDALQAVQIVSGGKAIWSAAFDELDIDVQSPLGKATAATYFYLRALQRDGGLIYASPVFVEINGI